MAPGIPRSHKPLFPTNGAVFVRTDIKFSSTMNIQFLDGLLSKALPKCSSVRRFCIAYDPKAAEQYRSGDQKVFGFFMGQANKALKGLASPKAIQEYIRKKLSE